MRTLSMEILTAIGLVCTLNAFCLEGKKLCSTGYCVFSMTAFLKTALLAGNSTYVALVSDKLLHPW